MSEPTYTIWNEDCIAGMAARLAPESIELTVTSIPFSTLFTYSGKTEDLSNCNDGIDSQASGFGLGLRFFIEQLLRVQQPGGIAAVHIQQLNATKVQHGYMGMRDFRGAVVSMFVGGGWDAHGECAVMKNPQAVAQRRKLHSLLFITGKRDARALAPAANDYVLFFRKPGEGKPVPAIFDPITNPGGWLTTDDWIKYAHGCWTDIHETDVVEGWKDVREQDDEKHVCPLQLEVIRRCIRLYSNPGALVLDPFMGVGSVAAVAIEQGRNAVGFELKESYADKAVKVCELALAKRRQFQQALPLFAGMTEAGAA